MATAVSSCGDGKHSAIDMHLADGNAAAGSTGSGELQRTDSAAGSSATGESQRTDSAAGSNAAGDLPPKEGSVDDKEMWKQLKKLNRMVFCIELLEYSSNAFGTVAFLWATVVLLGGFCSLLTRLDFWFATIMVFLEGTRVFISKDTTVNRWLFGSTRAFKWDHFCFPKMGPYRNLIAVIIGAGISLAPIEIGSQIITGILKVSLLAITSLLLTRRQFWFTKAVLSLLVLASFCGALYASYKMTPHIKFHGSSEAFSLARLRAVLRLLLLILKLTGLVLAWFFGTLAAAFVIALMMNCMVLCGPLCLKVLVTLALIFLPFLHAKLSSQPIYLGLAMATALAVVLVDSRHSRRYTRSRYSQSPQAKQEQRNALLLKTKELLTEILHTIMPILFFWAVLFPLPGIPMKPSFYMLFSVIAAVLVGNLQIPVSFLQILLSSLRLQSLLADHDSLDYKPLPDGASPNLVPSIVVFFVLELCQGSTNILGVIFGLFSFRCRRSLVRALGLEEEEWGAKAVNLYYYQAFMTIKKNGLFPMENSTPSGFDTFAIESLGCTSSEMQIVRLQVLDYYLQQGDSKSKSRLIAQIAKDAPGIVTKITGTISHLITDEEILSRGLKLKEELSLCLNLLWRLAISGGKIGTRFRHELSGNPILLHSLWRILDFEFCPQKLWKPTMDVIKLLALQDEATAKEIGSTHAVIPKLMSVFLVRGDVINLKDDKDGHSSVRKDAGEVLENLTITSSDNCRTILDLEGGPAGRRDLIKTLINMLQDDDECISVVANLLHNLYANSRDMLINLDLDNDAKEGLKSSLRREIKSIIGNENDIQQTDNSVIEVVKQLDAALHIVSQIGHVIPKEDFAHVLSENLAPNTNAAAEKLVGKLVDTLKSNGEPNREFPRLRRVLIEMVISIVDACPGYIEIFREKGAEEALNMLTGTSSRLENYKVFVEGEGMVPDSAPMQDVVDKAKELIMG